MVFQKPYKTGSCLHDVLAMENGDDTITCGGVDIEGNRCGVSEEDIKKNARTYLEGDRNGFVKTPRPAHDQSNGRFPAQTYIDSGASEIIDLQSGVLKSGARNPDNENNTTTLYGFGGKGKPTPSSSGGASRILHKCDFDKGDFDLYHYVPKVSKSERNEGLEGFEEKQTNETIMVFQKPYKTGSCLHDVLAMENGDDTITCGGVDIENNRVEAGEEITERKSIAGGGNGDVQFSGLKVKIYEGSPNGRFPAQTYIDSGASEIIDRQSGVSKSTGGTGRISLDTDTNLGGGNNYFSFGDSGGASRILHKCDYEAGDYDLYHYCPKVSKSERNEGLDGFEEKQYSHDGRHTEIENPFQRNKSIATNNHPTVKPKALLSKILKLFKTPNQQVILDPFMGSGSMGISAVETDFDYIGFELDPDYFKIAEARIANTQNKAEQRLL
jgi:hypothetical protein